MKKITFFLIYIYIISISALALPIVADDAEMPPAWCASVWYPSSEFEGGHATILTHADHLHGVNAFWYMPAPDGSLIVLPRAENADELSAWREAGLRVIPSIFGSVPDVIGERLREAHISAIVETVLRMDYDGIDIDYEGFPASTRDDFSLFVEGLAEALHAHDKHLSITVHAKTDDGVYEGARAQDWYRIIPATDSFRIMTYDYTNRNEPPGPISPVGWVLDVLAYATHVTDTVGEAMSKVWMGLHFYGYSWQRGTPPATTVAYAGISNYITSFNLEVMRDEADMEAYIDFRVTGLPRQVVYFADATGLAYRLERVFDAYPHLGGVAIWGVGGEDPALWDVLQDYTAGCDG